MKRLRPTTIIACLALFLSLGTSAWAAQHYIITKTSQIKPSVRSQLKGPIVGRNKEVNNVGPLALGEVAEAHVLCPAGSVPTGGGGQVTGGKLAIIRTSPEDGRGWAIEAQATMAGARGGILIFVFCRT